MFPSLKSSRIHFALATGICSLLMAGAAFSQTVLPPPITSDRVPQVSLDEEKPLRLNQDSQPEKARALLDQVKKSEQDRLIAVKQTELERLKEDQSKIERAANGLKKTVESTAGLMTASSDHLATLTTEKGRLEHELAVAAARISAEKLKIEGLRALTAAQGKSLDALARRAEEAAARTHLRTVELEMLQAGKRVPGEGREDNSQTELIKARKALNAAETKAESEERLVQDAMRSATSKMTQAETSAATAQRLADNEINLEALAAKPIPKAKPVEKPAPVASGPKPATTTATPSKPAAKSATTTPKKAASSSSAPPARRP